MRVVQENPAFDRPREEIRKYFSRGNLFFCADIHLSFVCGESGGSERSLRNQFLSFVSQQAGCGLVCVRAEEASIELLRQVEERYTTKSLSKFEKAIAETADSVLIFPESAGSIAELGFFSAFEDIAEKTLVALVPQHQNDSFINLGPIKHISTVSIFSPLPIIISHDQAATFERIAHRLLGGANDARPYRNRFVLQEFNEYEPRAMLSILDEIIVLLGIVTEPDLISIIHSVFGNFDISQVRLLLSILCATGRASRTMNGDLVYQSNGRIGEFIECDVTPCSVAPGSRVRRLM